jgi:hypothetical protein
MLAAAHDLLQPLTLLIREPPGPHWFCHRHSRRSIPDQEPSLDPGRQHRQRLSQPGERSWTAH